MRPNRNSTYEWAVGTEASSFKMDCIPCLLKRDTCFAWPEGFRPRDMPPRLSSRTPTPSVPGAEFSGKASTYIAGYRNSSRRIKLYHSDPLLMCTPKRPKCVLRCVCVYGARPGHSSHSCRLLYPVTVEHYSIPAAQFFMRHHGYPSVTPGVH
jgi:hypothetical protein